MSIEPSHRFDLLVRGGTVVRADGSRAADVGIRDGLILAVEAGIPPFGFFSRNFAIGEFSPSGSSSSILVLGNSTKIVVTP